MAIIGEKKKTLLAYTGLAAAFLGFLLWSQPEYGADPIGYANDALAFLQHPGPAQTRAVLEFGHLLWRPVAVAGAALTPQWLISFTGFDRNLVPLAWLVIVGVVFAFVGLLFVYRTARALTGSVIAGVIVSFALLLSNPFAIYLRSGYPYLTAAAMQMMAVSLIIRGPKRWPVRLRGLAIGCALAASVCLWAPYVVSVPGLVVFALVWNGDAPRRERMRLLFHAAAWSTCVVGVVFSTAILLNRFSSFGQIVQWIQNSSHAWAQTHRLVRLATGLPRSLISIQDQSVELKRIYFHDPYASTSLTHAFFAIAWKLVLYFLAMCALIWILARSGGGRRLLVGLACCWLPLIFFAVAVFEPGSPERFLPGFAVLFACLAYATGRSQWKDPASVVLIVFFAAAVVVNGISVSPAMAAIREQDATARLADFQKAWRPHSVGVLLSYRDGIYHYLYVHPFGCLGQSFHFFAAIEPGTAREHRFREEFREVATEAWKQGGDVWISRRLVARRPLPAWQWVEGDVPGVGWVALSGYYRQFQTDSSIGGADGFLRIARTPSNESLICGGKTFAVALLRTKY